MYPDLPTLTASVIFKLVTGAGRVSGMAYFPKTNSSVRAPRTSFQTPEPAEFRVEDRRYSGGLRRLSVTGGFAVLNARVRGGTLAEIAISTPLGPVTGLIEFFEQGARGKRTSELAFRFVGLNDSDYERLGNALRQFG